MMGGGAVAPGFLWPGSHKVLSYKYFGPKAFEPGFKRSVGGGGNSSERVWQICAWKETGQPSEKTANCLTFGTGPQREPKEPQC